VVVAGARSWLWHGHRGSSETAQRSPSQRGFCFLLSWCSLLARDRRKEGFHLLPRHDLLESSKEKRRGQVIWHEGESGFSLLAPFCPLVAQPVRPSLLCRLKSRERATGAQSPDQRHVSLTPLVLFP